MPTIPASAAELVPPPKKARVYQKSIDLGILPFMQTQKMNHAWRCAKCHRWQNKGAIGVEMPDALEFRDFNREELEEIVRRNSFNGTGFYGCLDCARRLTRQASRKSYSFRPSFSLTTILVVTALAIWFVVWTISLYGLSQ